MQLSLDRFKELSFVVGNEETISQMQYIKPMHPFSDIVLSFFNSLSQKLMKAAKEYSDVATFGFWCRRSALMKEKEKYDDIAYRFGRGIVFQSTPSNVPVNFAFSFAAGLLAGNANIVRLPAKDFPQVKIICNSIYEVLSETHKEISPYICMVKYPPMQEISDFFSELCDTRVVWGGDATIAEFRRSPLKPRANEFTFADRHSFAVIHAGEYLKSEDKDKIAIAFYNDTYLSDQNACTAPRVIIWLGPGKQKAKEIFWQQIHLLVKDKYTMRPVQSVGKLHALYKVASLREVRYINGKDMLINRIEVDQLDDELMNFKYNSGFFFEYDVEQLDEIIPLCDDRCQTLTYYGLSDESIRAFFDRCRPRGIDRVVPMGKSMDFSLVWDGYDLIRGMSRRINII